MTRPSSAASSPSKAVPIFPFKVSKRLRLAQEPRLQPRQTIAHRIEAEIRLPQRDRRGFPVVALACADQHQRSVGGKGELRQRAGKA